MRSLPLSSKLGVLLTFATLIAETAPNATIQFGWQAGLFAQEPWRVLTAHFVHLSWVHSAANFAALALICWVASNLRAGGSLAAVLGAWIGITIGLAVGFWSIEWYAGLSGLLYGWFAGLAFELCLMRGRVAWVGALLLVGGALKIGFDLGAGPIFVGALGIPVAAPVHLYGYAGGLAAASVEYYVWRRRRSA